MYWLSADPAERLAGEQWEEYVHRSCAEVAREFDRVVGTTDFSKILHELPPDLQEICHRNFSAVALAERDDFVAMTKSEQQNLTSKGLTFNAPDLKPFRDALTKSGYYPDMKKTAGDKPWVLLEKYVGPLTA